MTPMSPEAQMLYRLLADGGWHRAETIREQLAATIAPGKALRRYRARQASRERSGRAVIEHTEPEAIAMGQNEIAANAMRTWCDTGLDEVSGQPTVRWRHDPRDLDIERSAAEPAGALSEQRMREIVASETAAVLDVALSEFQKGMQGFLVEQFAAVEALIGGPPPLRMWPPRSSDG